MLEQIKDENPAIICANPEDDVESWNVTRDHEMNTRRLPGDPLVSEEVQDRQQGRQYRMSFANRMFNAAVCYLIVLLIICLIQGFNVKICGHTFNLNDKVLIALITLGGVNVLGVIAIVFRYLFPQRKQ